jgi:hypothetical protein
MISVLHILTSNKQSAKLALDLRYLVMISKSTD